MAKQNPSSSPSSMVQTFDVPDVSTPTPIYSAASIVTIGTTRLISLSGQVATALDGSVPLTFMEQFDVAFTKLEKTLASLNADIRDVRRLGVYVVEGAWKYEGEETLTVFAPRWIERMKGHKPACALYVVKGLSKREYLVELEAEVVSNK